MADDLSSVSYIGYPEDVFRVTDPVYADEARADFDRYVKNVITASQRRSGRFNAQGEFGALYTSTEEDLAWTELANRWKREGVNGLPPRMGVIRIIIEAGRVADLTNDEARKEWAVMDQTLVAEEPTLEQQQRCWAVGRSIRVLCDLLRTESARAKGTNVVIFPDRDNSELRFSLGQVREVDTPTPLRAKASETW